MTRRGSLILLTFSAACAGRAGVNTAAAPGHGSDTTSADRPQYASTYHRHENPPVLIRNATIMTAGNMIRAHCRPYTRLCATGGLSSRP